MSKSREVPIQKGKVVVDMPTSKMMTYPEKVREREKEYKEIRDGQTLKLHTPKK